MQAIPASSCLSGMSYPDNGFADMTTMTSLHEAYVLHNLRLRFERKLIYVTLMLQISSLSLLFIFPVDQDCWHSRVGESVHNDKVR